MLFAVQANSNILVYEICEGRRRIGLFPHHSVHADAAGAYQQDGEKCGQVDQGELMLFDGLSFVEEEGGHCETDDQDQGCHAGEEA